MATTTLKAISELSHEERCEENRLYEESLKKTTCFTNFLGDALKELRTDFAKKTQRQLAESSDLTQAQISGYERGDFKPDFDGIKKLSIGLGVDASIIFQLAFDKTRFGDKKLVQLPIEQYVYIKTKGQKETDDEIEKARLKIREHLIENKKKELEELLEA